MRRGIGGLPSLAQLPQAALGQRGHGDAAAGAGDALHLGGGLRQIAPLQRQAAEADIDAAAGQRQRFGIGQQAGGGALLCVNAAQHALGQIERQHASAFFLHDAAEMAAARADIEHGLAGEIALMPLLEQMQQARADLALQRGGIVISGGGLAERAGDVLLVFRRHCANLLPGARYRCGCGRR